MIAMYRLAVAATLILAVHSACKYGCPPVNNAVQVLAYSTERAGIVACEYGGGSNCYYDATSGKPPASPSLSDSSCPSTAVCQKCTPLASCSAGHNCGTQSDGCGGTLHCGTCAPPQTCGGSGLPYTCGHPCDGPHPANGTHPCSFPGPCEVGNGLCSVGSDGAVQCAYEQREDGSACSNGYCRAGQCINPCAAVNCSAPPLCRASKCESIETVPICTYPKVADGTSCGNGGTCHYGYCLGQLVRRFRGIGNSTLTEEIENRRVGWARFQRIFAPALSATAAAFVVLAIVYVSLLRRRWANPSGKLAAYSSSSVATAI